MLDFRPYTWHTPAEWAWLDRVQAFLAEHPPWHDPRSDDEMLAQDLVFYGVAVSVGGRRVDPTTVTIRTSR